MQPNPVDPSEQQRGPRSLSLVPWIVPYPLTRFGLKHRFMLMLIPNGGLRDAQLNMK
jgi:hypothetical protein